MKLIEHFISGKSYSGNSNRKSKIFNPATGEQSAEVKLASSEDVNKAVKHAADNELKGILEYSEIPLVSTDILNNPHSSIYDASSTQLLDGNHIKVVCWYDNEWGYSNRVVDLIGNLLNNG